MAVLEVRIFGDPVLRQKARPIDVFDDALRAFISDMRDTMKAYDGVGLAANQVGVTSRVLVLDVPLDDGERAQLAIVNPEITQRSGSETGEEGCLSIPGVYEDVARATRLTIRGRDEHGAAVEYEAEGFLARAMQHEVDHLDGVLFIDRLSPLKRQFLRKALEALARGDLPDGYRGTDDREGAR
jgi:peptide deformylase